MKNISVRLSPSAQDSFAAIVRKHGGSISDTQVIELAIEAARKTPKAVQSKSLAKSPRMFRVSDELAKRIDAMRSGRWASVTSIIELGLAQLRRAVEAGKVSAPKKQGRRRRVEL